MTTCEYSKHKIFESIKTVMRNVAKAPFASLLQIWLYVDRLQNAFYHTKGSKT